MYKKSHLPLFSIDLTTYPQIIDYGKLSDVLDLNAAPDVIYYLKAGNAEVAKKIKEEAREEKIFRLFKINLHHKSLSQLITNFNKEVEFEENFNLFSATASDLASFQLPTKMLFNYAWSGIRLVVIDQALLAKKPGMLMILEDGLVPLHTRDCYFATEDSLPRKMKPTFILTCCNYTRIIKPLDQAEIKHEVLMFKKNECYKGFPGTRGANAAEVGINLRG